MIGRLRLGSLGVLIIRRHLQFREQFSKRNKQLLGGLSLGCSEIGKGEEE